MTWSTYIDGQQKRVFVNSNNDIYLIGQCDTDKAGSTNAFPFTASTSCTSHCFNPSTPYSATGTGSIIKFNASTLAPEWGMGFGSTINGYTTLTGICSNGNGGIYLVGYSDSTTNNFSVVHTGGEYSQSYGGGYQDGIIMEFDSNDNLLYSTWFGGNDVDALTDVAYSQSAGTGGGIYISGWTGSTNFPTQNTIPGSNNFKSTSYTGTTVSAGGSDDAVFAQMNITNTMFYSTYYGGTALDRLTGVVAGPSGSAFVTGFSNSSNVQTVTPASYYSQSQSGQTNALVAEFQQGSLVWSTYVGGSETDEALAITIDANDLLYITGSTFSYYDSGASLTGYPEQNPGGGAYFQPLLNGESAAVNNSQQIPAPDVFITQFDVNPNYTSISQITEAEPLIVYPNPTSTAIIIANASLVEGFQATIYNDIGQMVYHTENSGRQIDVSAFASGIYLLKVTGGYSFKTAKFVKQ